MNKNKKNTVNPLNNDFHYNSEIRFILFLVVKSWKRSVR